MIDFKNFSAILLCGGQSRRMGRDKASLPFGGKTLLLHQLDKLRALGIEDILLSGHMVSPLPGTRTIEDIYPLRGPLGGLHAGLQAAANAACLVLSVDVPLISSETLSSLLTYHAVHHFDASVLACKDRPEPLIAVYQSALHRIIEPLISSGGASVRAFLERIDCSLVPFAGSPDELLNCNTPEDYAKALACRKFDAN